MALAEDQKVAKSVARELRADEAEHDAAVVETGGVVKWRDPQIRGISLQNIKNDVRIFRLGWNILEFIDMESMIN